MKSLKSGLKKIVKLLCGRAFLLFVVALGLVGCTFGPHPIKREYVHKINFGMHIHAFHHKVGNDGIWRDIRNDFVFDDFSNDKTVQEQIHWYQRHPSNVKSSLEHSRPYIYYIYQEIKHRGLPVELALLPVLESGYNPYDTSWAHAGGLWQIIPGTASTFGLKMNSWYDGRRDVVASTRAALKYFTYLHEYFNDDWLLAIAAYDAGEGKIQSAINHSNHSGNDNDFWSLKLPHETRNYVPRLLALIAIINDPEKYGFELPNIENREYFQIVDTTKQVDLRKVAKLLDMDLTSLRKLNPAFHRNYTDPNGPYTLLLPVDKVATFKKNLDKLGNVEVEPEHKVVYKSVKKNKEGAKKHSAVKSKTISSTKHVQTNNKSKKPGKLTTSSRQHKKSPTKVASKHKTSSKKSSSKLN